MSKPGFNQTYDQEGNLLSSTPVTVPDPVVNPAQFDQAKQTAKNMMNTYFPSGTPTGNPTNAEIRNWLIALTTGIRYLYGAMDNE